MKTGCAGEMRANRRRRVQHERWLTENRAGDKRTGVRRDVDEPGNGEPGRGWNKDVAERDSKINLLDFEFEYEHRPWRMLYYKWNEIELL